MSTSETKNARIESTMLGYEDHGILTCYLHLTFGGCRQGFGGYSMDAPNGHRDANHRRIGTAYGMEFIARILETVGVTKWEDLKGKHIRVRGDMSSIEAIGHIIEDKWFAPKTDLAELAGRKAAP